LGDKAKGRYIWEAGKFGDNDCDGLDDVDMDMDEMGYMSDGFRCIYMHSMAF
jgi:hypothetical protein